jgi:rRNA maturation RNase YbeY
LIKSISEEIEFKIYSLEINFVDLETIKEVNNTYMKHNYETDIVTLDYSKKNDRLDTELFISYDVAKENAEKFKVSLNEELIRLIIHGILHVTGFDDTSPAEKRKMKKVENKLTKKFNNIDLSPVIK